MSDEKKDAVMKRIYNEISTVLGAGSQLFTMAMPAQPLNYRRFVYDTDDRNSVLTKPYVIAEAEFRLSDQLFDTAPIVQGSNGEKLSTVYNTLINNYVPRVGELAPFFRDRAGLSKFLLQPSGEKDGNGEPISRMKLTNMLYEKYLNAKNEWEKEKNATFDSYKEKGNLDGYSKWMTSEGLVRNEQLNNLYNDVIVRGHLHEVMTLLGYINSSSTAEQLEMVKQRMRHSVRLSLDESMLIYPVQFQPSNWFMALTPNLRPQDLTMARDKVSMQLRSKRKQLSRAKSKMAELELNNVSPSEVRRLEEEVEKGRDKLDNAETQLIEKYGDGVVTAAKTALKFKEVAEDMSLEAALDAETYGIFSIVKGELEDLGLVESNEDKIVDSIKEALTSLKDTYIANKKVVKQQRRLLQLEAKKANAEAHDMRSEKIRLTERIEDLEADVKYLSEMASGTQGEAARLKLITKSLLKDWGTKKEVARRNVLVKCKEMFPSLDFGKPIDQLTNVELLAMDESDLSNKLDHIPQNYSILPKSTEAATIDGMFMDVSISIEKTEDASDILKESSASDVQASASFMFGSASVSHSHSKASNNVETSFLSQNMEIGFRVAKVSFDRGGWFNPSLFNMSKAFFHLADFKAGDGLNVAAIKNGTTVDKTKTLLPSFPTGFVIAKDITIKISDVTDVSKYSKTVEESSTQGSGGLFCFSVSGGSSSKSVAESSFSGHNGKDFYMRIPGPQILGYFQQFVEKDESAPYEAMFGQEEVNPLVAALNEFNEANTHLPDVQEVDAELKTMEKLIEKGNGVSSPVGTSQPVPADKN